MQKNLKFWSIAKWPRYLLHFVHWDTKWNNFLISQWFFMAKCLSSSIVIFSCVLILSRTPGYVSQMLTMQNDILGYNKVPLSSKLSWREVILARYFKIATSDCQMNNHIIEITPTTLAKILNTFMLFIFLVSILSNYIPQTQNA